MPLSLRKPSSLQWHWLDKDAGVWATVFLLPTFFQRVFMGGEAASYDELSGVSMTALGYVCHLAVVGKYALTPVSPVISTYIVERFTPLLLVSIFHVCMLVLAESPGAMEGMLAVGRQLVWVLCCLTMLRLTTAEKLLERLVQFTHLTFGVIALTYVFYVATNIPIQLLLSDGTPRAQGFLTEPSGMGCLLAGYSALAAHERKWRRLLVAVAVAILVNSVIGFIGLAIGTWSALIRHSVPRRGPRSTLFIGMFMLMPLGLILAPVLSRDISAGADSLIQYFDSTSFAQNPFYLVIGIRALQAASVLDIGIQLVASGDNITEGGLFRFTSVLLLLEQMQHSWHLAFGYGLGVHAQLMAAVDQSVLDFGIFPLVLSSFGLVGAIVVFGWLVWTLSRSSSRLAVYALPFGVITTFNSAGGIHMYSVVLLAAFFISSMQDNTGREPTRRMRSGVVPA